MRTETIRGIVLGACVPTVIALIVGLRSSALGVLPDDSIVLFTPNQARQLRVTIHEWKAVTMPRALSVGPQIVVRRPPVLPGAIPTINAQSPTDLYVSFEPRSAPVQMNSLDVTAHKGFFSRSLTDKLRPYIRGDSIEMSQVEIPAGRFLLDISIADTNGNITNESFRLEVGRK